MAKVCRRTGKPNYRSEGEAVAGLIKAAASRTVMREHVKAEAAYYKCPFCPYWHLTSELQMDRTRNLDWILANRT